jgi:methylamine dehydrogenase accessory protein MauD
VADLDGRAHRLGGARADGRSTLLLFVSPSCPVCKSLLPAVKSSRRGERGWMDVILASDGDAREQREFVRAHGLDGIPLVVSAALGLAYQVSRLPFAALLDEQGILRARGLVNSREHLESLFEAKRLGVASLQEYFAGASPPETAPRA